MSTLEHADLVTTPELPTGQSPGGEAESFKAVGRIQKPYMKPHGHIQKLTPWITQNVKTSTVKTSLRKLKTKDRLKTIATQ